jgi:YHS domain-containing protein
MKRHLAILFIALTLNGCAMVAQNPGGKYSPVNAVAADGAPHLMLKGHDVVAYFTLGRHALGRADFASRYADVDFHFASAEHKALFDANPEKYLPRFGGYCANGIAYGIPWGGDADTWLIIDGKLTIFGGQFSKDAFMLDPATNLQRAETYWRDEVAGSNSFIQRARHLVFRVPHYKSGEELARLVAEAKSKK